MKDRWKMFRNLKGRRFNMLKMVSFNESMSDRKGKPSWNCTCDRFKRMALVDLFVMGRAGLSPTSLFGASPPAPWSYMQDHSNYFFGDDREKDRAFYGTLSYP